MIDTPASQSPQGMRPRGVTHAPGEEQPTLKMVARPLKGQCYKNKWGFIINE